MFFLKYMNGIFSFFSQLQWNPIAQSKRRKKLLVHVHNKIHQSNSNSFLGAQEYHTTIYHTTQHTMPSLSMTLLWLGRVSKLPLLSLCTTFALPSLPEARTEREKEEGKEEEN